MKSFNFIYTEKSRVVSRTYGGSTYVLNVYQIEPKSGELKFIGEAKACTRGHKGEESEAFGVIVKNCPQIIKTIERRCKQILKTEPNNYYAKYFLTDVRNSGGYYSWNFKQLGISLKGI